MSRFDSIALIELNQMAFAQLKRIYGVVSHTGCGSATKLGEAIFESTLVPERDFESTESD